MNKQSIYKPWVELSIQQQQQVVAKLSKLSKEEGVEYLKKPGMRYHIDEEGNATGGHQDPYLFSKIF